jgi:hypothetical protein
MKKITFLLLGLCISNFIFSQIPNAGLENWYTETETATHFFVPQHWISSDEVVNTFFSGYSGISVTQTATSYSGSFAAMMQVAANNSDTCPGAIYSCDSLAQFMKFIFNNKMAGFPCTLRPASLQGYYKFTGVGGDSATCIVLMTKWNSVTHKRDTINYTKSGNGITAAAYTFFNVPLHYINNAEYPDTALMGIGIQGKNGKTAHIGSIMYVDALAFNGSVNLGVNELNTESGNVMLYPNPFNNNATLSISPQIKLNNAIVEIYNVLGQTVRTIQNISENNINIEKGNLQSGIYFYRLLNNSEPLSTGKFILN